MDRLPWPGDVQPGVDGYASLVVDVQDSVISGKHGSAVIVAVGTSDTGVGEPEDGVATARRVGIGRLAEHNDFDPSPDAYASPSLKDVAVNKL